MKLAVSNIAWDAPEAEHMLAGLARAGVRGIEVAPTKLWPDWTGASPSAARKAALRFSEAGFSVPALQAILFGRPDLLVFGTAEQQAALVEHIERVAALAEGLGARVLVFGSPRNRDPGVLSADEAMDRAADLFRRMAERCEPHGVCLCLEPNPGRYDCRFLTRWQDVVRMVERVDHPGLQAHFDVACVALEGDDPAAELARGGPMPAHLHVTEPDLGPFGAPSLDHARIGAAVRARTYPNWISIEMRRADDPLSRVLEAVELVKRCYG
ncbi:MAG: sugar phosphate isomerase/epimerase [Alphaproteobacteria bacterium]|nr:sugar phosphate isomerase/epimerase [Alphaproteobacteria bacterium]